MATTQSHISNNAVRILLQKIGELYDEAREFDRFVPNAKQKDSLLEFFGNKCCYCGAGIERNSLSKDHLIPINRDSLGLHAWGNVVPCCKICNTERNKQNWREFTVKKSSADAGERIKRIEEFVSQQRYAPDFLSLRGYIDSLYKEVGDQAMKLINFRYKQVEEDIKLLISRNTL